MNISRMIEEIIETGSRGKELVKDSFIIGLAWGRQILKDNNDLQLAIKQLSSINDNIDNSTISPFYKEDKFNEFLNNNNFQLFNIPRLSNQQPYQVTPPQKKLQENQQPLNNLQNQSPFKGNVSPQKGKELQSLKTCQLCNFYTDPSKTIQIAKLSQCQHQFHFLCLYIHIQEYGEYCPICQQDLEKTYPQYIFESIQLEQNIYQQIYISTFGKTKLLIYIKKSFLKITTHTVPQQYKSCCPSLKCLNYFIYFGQDVYNCNGCKEKWCLKCKKQYHHNSECTFEIDHYRMSLGQKFKCCLNCKKVLFLNELPINLNQAFPKHC